MEVRSCRSCGKLYNYLGPNTPFCPSCMAQIEEKFQRCKEYIRNNPGANMQEVSEANDVSTKMIKQWVREERLTFAEGSCVGIECESCGAQILTGRYCNACKGKMAQSFTQAIRPVRTEPEPKKEKDSPKMRFIDGKN